jgi:hypothetical protein
MNPVRTGLVPPSVGSPKAKTAKILRVTQPEQKAKGDSRKA